MLVSEFPRQAKFELLEFYQVKYCSSKLMGFYEFAGARLENTPIEVVAYSTICIIREYIRQLSTLLFAFVTYHDFYRPCWSKRIWLVLLFGEPNDKRKNCHSSGPKSAGKETPTNSQDWFIQERRCLGVDGIMKSRFY